MNRKKSDVDEVGTKRPVTVYLPEKMHDRIRVCARIQDTAMSAVIERVMAKWLDENAETIDQAIKLMGKLSFRR